MAARRGRSEFWGTNMRAIGIGLAGGLWLTFAGLATAQDTAEALPSGDSATEAAAPSAEQPNPFAELKWIHGPTEVAVGEHAQLTVPDGFMYLEPAENTKFQNLIQNPSNGRESLIAPADLRWFGLFDFEDVGYVKDDETIDADALLESVKAGTEAGNEERRSRGWAELTITGWRFQPRYDPETQRLEWAIEAVSENLPVVNFNTRLLGRRGVTAATLVADPAALDPAVTEFKQVLTGFNYNEGETYAEFKEGDKMAEYGLAALIAGGGAAIAAKTGLLKGLWKFLVAGGIAVAAWLAKIFKGRKQDA